MSRSATPFTHRPSCLAQWQLYSVTVLATDRPVKEELPYSVNWGKKKRQPLKCTDLSEFNILTSTRKFSESKEPLSETATDVLSACVSEIKCWHVRIKTIRNQPVFSVNFLSLPASYTHTHTHIHIHIHTQIHTRARVRVWSWQTVLVSGARFWAWRCV